MQKVNSFNMVDLMNKKNITVQFLGAAGTVTGSKYLIKANHKVLLIDCGLFQGLKALRNINREPLPLIYKNIDLVLLTHGHLDHCGYLPCLVRDGYKGEIWGTAPTLKVAEIILKDSAKIQEEEAAQANRLGYSKHHPALPLYTAEDAEKTITRFSPQPLNEWITIDENISVRYRYNGHILGATFIELRINDKLFVFSGDIGRIDDPVLHPFDKPEQADILFIESTYGDRLHPADAEEKMTAIIQKAFEEQVTVIIPSFAVERAQSVLYLLHRLRNKKIIPDIPVYLDTPMGENVLELFNLFPSWHKLSSEELTTLAHSVKFIQSEKETQHLAQQKSSKIIIAGSGMGSGGRVMTYFQHYLGDPHATIMLVGYQAEGTRGRQLLEGVHEIKMFGKYYPVQARIENIQGLSAHADQKELLSWLSNMNESPERIFIVHGEPQASDALRVKLLSELGWDSEIPKLYDIVEL
jgi:metallo-beta-lactamase family protein